MTPHSQPNTALTEISEYVEGCFKGGSDAPQHFAELINLLLKTTIGKPSSFVQVHRGGKKNVYVVAPPKRALDEMKTAAKGNEIYKSLLLTNGYYLAIRYHLFTDESDGFLKTTSSKIAYQLDDLGYQQLIRFDMARTPKNHYPFAHMHIYGNWQHSAGQRDLPKIHFPTPRTTVESVIRMLIYEFAVTSNSEHSIYEPMLAHSEAEFLRVARTKPKEMQPAPGAGTVDEDD